jgi:restriction system protein
MAVPGYQTFMRPLLELLTDGQEHVVREAYGQVADRCGLTDADRQELIPSGTQRLLDNRVGWARTYLLKAGLLESPRRGVIRITQRGREALATSQAIDSRFLRRFPEFIEFQRGDDGEDQAAEPEKAGEGTVAAETTPEELIVAGYRQVQTALASDLLDRVKAASPAFFERLVVQLLVKMGCGGSIEDAGKALGRPGDEGIDGIIKEDRLGLDLIVAGRSAPPVDVLEEIGWAEPHVLADLHHRQRVGRAASAGAVRAASVGAEFGLVAKAHVVLQRYGDASEGSGGLAAREPRILSTRSGEGLVG